MKNTDNHQKADTTRGSFLSMAVSLLLVGGVILFVFGFKYFLDGQKYHGNTVAEDTAAVAYDAHREYLTTQSGFSACYIMIKNVDEDGFYASEIPGEKDESIQQLENGQLVYAVKKGTYDGKVYYHLKSGLYIQADKERTEELSSYSKVSGYVVITYISSSGVRVRSWADFDVDDNIVKSVYVGDKVYIKGKVITSDGTSAYLTRDGLYLTTDVRYLNDYTEEPAVEEDTEESERSTESGE